MRSAHWLWSSLINCFRYPRFPSWKYRAFIRHGYLALASVWSTPACCSIQGISSKWRKWMLTGCTHTHTGWSVVRLSLVTSVPQQKHNKYLLVTYSGTPRLPTQLQPHTYRQHTNMCLVIYACEMCNKSFENRRRLRGFFSLSEHDYSLPDNNDRFFGRAPSKTNLGVNRKAFQRGGEALEH